MGSHRLFFALSLLFVSIGHPASASDQDALLDAARGADFVLLGEATHGTSEFYSERAALSQRLAQDARTGAIVIEADPTEVERVNRYVRGIGPDLSASEALSGFRRFPRWMWRNREFSDFVERLRTLNLARPPAARLGVYGMDVYDLYGALDRVRAYFRRENPTAMQAANAAAKCFAPFRRSGEAYGVASRKPSRTCDAQAEALVRAMDTAPLPAGGMPAEEHFAAVQAAATVVAGEAYYRAAYAGSCSWNVRERSMAAAVTRVAQHAGMSRDHAARVLIWAHNSHVAEAASTTMAERGEVSMADLLRRREPGKVFTVGFLTHSGSFMAAPAWGRPGQIYRLEPAARNSVEGLLLRSAGARASLMLRGPDVPPALAEWRPQRAIGAVFDSADASSIYARARLASEFDAAIFVAETKAVRPL